MTGAAVWYRVSTDRQKTDNQVPEVAQFAAHHGYEVLRRFTVDDSAWRNGGGPVYKAELSRALEGAWRGEYRVLIVWALDRITRNGAEDALRLIRQFRDRGCTLVSVRESWLNGSPEVQDVLVSFAGWMAQQESKRRSDRVKAGMLRARAAGKHVGRPAGSRDKRQRRTSGYIGNTNAAGK